jgi:glycerophosphoryl diester phosphodiesterase
MNILEDLPRPLLFAHRGASAHAPENTLAAFRLAQESGSPAIELDSKLTVDGKVVVIHDPTVDRTTDGSGVVNRMSLSALRTLDAGNKFNTRFAGERIPTLEEVFETFGHKLYINIELTNYSSPFDQLPSKVALLVKRFGLGDWVLFSSFFMINLIQVKRELPQIPVAILALIGAAGCLARSDLGRVVSPKIIHPNISDINQPFINHQHSVGRRVHVWVVNNPQDITSLVKLGVDGIITDNPSLANQILRV